MGDPILAAVLLLAPQALASPDEEDVETVEVSANLPWDRRPSSRPIEPDDPPGAWRLSGGDIERLPGAAADPARALQALPGVHAANLRTTAISVRGGAPGETLWVVDGVPLPAPRSAGGLLSRLDASILDRLVLHAGAQPAEVPGSLGGAVHATLLDPSDTLTELSAELSPFLARGFVSAPIGTKGRGNGVWIAARRSLLEPSLAVLSSLGVLAEQTVRVQDLAARVQVEPHPNHRLHLTAIAGESLIRSDAPPTGLDLLPQDRVATLLLSARHKTGVGDAIAFSHLVAWTREAQRVDNSDEDQRWDRRDRLAGRVEAIVAPTSPSRLHLGAEVALFSLTSEGRYLDPRTAPPFLSMPWRRMDPPVVEAQGQRGWTEVSGWAEAPFTLQRLDLRPGLRVTGIASEGERWLLPEPRASVRYTSPAGSMIQGQGALLHAMARDPLDLIGPGAGPLTPARVAQADLSLQQATGEGSALRLDVWARWLDRLTVWEGPAMAGAPLGEGSAMGADVRWITRRERVFLVVGGGLQRVRRGGPLDPFRGERFETSWAVPWSLTAQGGLTTPGRWPLDLGASILVRSGLAQIPLDWEAREDAVVFMPRFDHRPRLGPRGRLGLRAERQIAVAGTVDLSLYADVIVPFGALNETLIGGAVDPETGEVTPPVSQRLRDLPVVPWIGVRARR